LHALKCNELEETIAEVVAAIEPMSIRSTGSSFNPPL
jgi:hypothetical protein